MLFVKQIPFLPQIDMLSKFYIQFLTFLAVICYAVNAKAQDYSLIAAAGQKVYVPVELLSETSTIHFLLMGKR